MSTDLAIDLVMQWLPIAAMAVMLSTFIVALAYMVAHFLGDEKLKAWGKSEAMQIFYSILILALILSLYGILNTVLSSVASFDPQSAAICQADSSASGNLIVGTNPRNHDSLVYYVPMANDPNSQITYSIPCHIGLANNYLEQVFSNAKQLNRHFIGIAVFYHTVSTASLTFETLVPPTTAITVMPLAGLSIVADSISQLFEITVRLMALLRLQQFFLALVQRALFPLFLVIGIILRTFFFTRKLGGLLLALGLCLYTVFPGVYIIGSYVLGQSTNGTYSLAEFNYDKLPTLSFDPSSPEGAFPKPSTFDANPPATPAKDAADFCKPETNPSFTDQFWTKAKAVLTFVKDLFSLNILTMVKNQLGGTWLLGEGGAIDSVAQLAIYTTLIPFIAIMMTLAAVKVMSPLFGGDVDIPGLSRLI